MGIIFQPFERNQLCISFSRTTMGYHLGRFSGLAIKVELFRVVTDFKLGGKTIVFRPGNNAGRTFGIIRAAISLITMYSV